MATKKDTPQENNEISERRRGFFWLKRDGSIDKNESIDQALSVLEYLNHIDGFCSSSIEIDLGAQHGLYLIQRAAIDTIRECQKEVAHG